MIYLQGAHSVQHSTDALLGKGMVLLKLFSWMKYIFAFYTMLFGYTIRCSVHLETCMRFPVQFYWECSSVKWNWFHCKAILLVQTASGKSLPATQLYTVLFPCSCYSGNLCFMLKSKYKYWLINVPFVEITFSFLLLVIGIPAIPHAFRVRLQ